MEDILKSTQMAGDEELALAHYGILRKSGRYPWGSGKDIPTRSRAFLDHVQSLRNEGMRDTDIAKGFGMTTTELRNFKTIARNANKQYQISQAQKLKDKGMSNVAIGERMGINESSVRALLVPGQKEKADIIDSVSTMLKHQVDTRGYIDIGSGVENHINHVGISKEKLDTAVQVLKQQGYVVHNVQLPQLGTNHKTLTKVLAPSGTTYRDIAANLDKINFINEISDDGGRSFFGLLPPISVNSKRIKVNYAEDGGAENDGMIYVRPGAPGLSLGKSRYAQVRVLVDGTHYLKGMAVYKDGLPPGSDLVFNTSKKRAELGNNKLDAMKAIKDDPDNPFGSMVRQITEKVHGGPDKVTSAMNLVNEEGDWGEWKRRISSQVLSKQAPPLAKKQLDLTLKTKQDDLDEISRLTNPAVRRKLLESFADDVDSAAVHLKAAALPRQISHVILPLDTINPKEIYAPNYRDGTRVSLIRYPHGGTFEIPELTVNNRHPEGREVIGSDAPDAVGIHHSVAKRLSGADFDGDTVLVIPQTSRARLKSTPPLAGLKDFDPQHSYKPYDGMKTIDGGTYNASTKKVEFPPGKRSSPRGKGTQMGLVSNLITDMTIKGATTQELAQAVRHSMVVIDAEKHHLDYKRSSAENGIPALMKKYQGRSAGGANTLISKATSAKAVDARRPRRASEGGPIDPLTGRKVFVPTGETKVGRNGKVEPVKIRSTKLGETHDAHLLSSGTPIEEVYAEHSNAMKALANKARLALLKTPPQQRNPSAAQAYSREVTSLDAKLKIAVRNRPLERQALKIAGTVVKAKQDANPEMDKAELNKIKGAALMEARTRMGVQKKTISLTQEEWNAIQAGAISNNKLKQILDNADLDSVKKLATPRATVLMTPTKVARAQAMIASGYTQADIADQLGVSLSTLKLGLKS